MRLTDEQITATVDRVYGQLPPKIKATILRRALAGDQDVRFALHAHYQRQQNGTTAEDAVNAWKRRIGLAEE